MFGLVMAVLRQTRILDTRIAAGGGDAQIEFALAVAQQDHAARLTRLAPSRQWYRPGHSCPPKSTRRPPPTSSGPATPDAASPSMPRALWRTRRKPRTRGGSRAFLTVI